MLPIQTILHPTDFSDSAGHAFRLACSLARDYGARVHVLHVAKAPDIELIEALIPPEPEHYREKLSTDLCNMHADDPRVQVNHQLIFGHDAAGEIVRVAEAIHADLIVMRTHGRTGLRRLLLGSVAAHVLRRAPCPVVTVKSPSLPSDSAADDSAVKTCTPAGSAG